MEKFHNPDPLKIKKLPPFCKYAFKLATTPSMFGSGFLGVDGNVTLVFAIMKKLKNGCHFINIRDMEKI